MPDLLLELRCEEIPARMQRKAAGDLRKMVTDGLVEAGLTYEAAREYWTPRRLALDIRGLTARSKDVREEKRGPSTKAPEQAIAGFLRAAGLSDMSQAHVHTDPKKGDFYVAHLVRPGRSAEAIIAELLPAVIRAFPWPKSMRWGAASGPKGGRYGAIEGRGGEALRWVRPLQSILCTFGPDTEEPVVIDFEVDGIRAGNVTFGHRFHAPEPITVRRFDDYAAKLEAAKVVLDSERRKSIILSDARNLAFASGLDVVEDEALLEEVAGLVEWPVVLMGAFELEFLGIPSELIRLTIRANQKCFVTRSAAPISPHVGETSQPPLAPRFILTANIEASDGGAEIARGNGKVVRARLSDALYFWNTDQADLPDLDRLGASADKFDLRRDPSGKLLPLDQRMARLDHLGVTFHAKLGTQGERVERVRRLAQELAPVVARSLSEQRRGDGGLISPGAGEMGGSPEEGAVPPASRSATPHSATRQGDRSTLPPSALPGISPTRGEISQPAPPAHIGADIAALAARAAVLAKADLTTEVVGEFPELQGLIGRKYAALQGEHSSVAAAIEEHYKPQGPSDRVPTNPVSIAVALADKLDTLVGFWAIDEKPTGSKDPYALRRAALGVIRIVVENGVRVGIAQMLRTAVDGMIGSKITLYRLMEARNRAVLIVDIDEFKATQLRLMDALAGENLIKELVGPYSEEVLEPDDRSRSILDAYYDFTESYELINGNFERLIGDQVRWGADRATELRDRIADHQQRHERLRLYSDLLAFFHERLKVYLRDKGARHDLIDAVLAADGKLISPLEGEMPGRAEGDTVPPTSPPRADAERSRNQQREAPPSGLPPISPSRGEISQRAGTSAPADGRQGRPAVAPDGAPPRSEPLSGDSVSAGNDDLLTIVRRVEALGTMLDTEDGRNLLAGTKRAVNILAAEEKKGTVIGGQVDPSLFADPTEQELFAAVNRAESEAAQAIQREDFSAAMTALSALREPVDSFFERVLVNVEDAAIRANRLALLARIRAATGQVADFSKIAG